ncbi:hypothetical protein [Chelativorans sp. Marseille-P2723]|uniref:hypothetical protein n=1 Tax=Chelativorans sp. Marseille-P2723 TaxID=2709133 RepID=UPI00156EFE88|nr:hypothetical protein [Chelativorans sp. Marseille-P2723]
MLKETLGEAPRVRVAKLARMDTIAAPKIIASGFGNIGFEMIAGPLFQSPEEVADPAARSKVPVAGISSLAADHKTLDPQLLETLKAQDCGCLRLARVI